MTEPFLHFGDVGLVVELAVIVEWTYDVDHPVVWATLFCVFVALRIIGRGTKSTCGIAEYYCRRLRQRGA